MPYKIIGIDIGGTKISMVIAKSDGDILKKEVILTEGTKPPKGTFDRVKKTIRGLMKDLGMKEKDIKGIGIGCVGPLDPESGILHSTPNIPAWKSVHIKDEISSEFDLPIVMDNDANAAALGEKLFGAGRNVRNLFYYTISTGIGGGLIIDGRIYQGASFDAGEVGHTTVLPDGPMCNYCKKRGCLENLSSGTAIARIAREMVKKGRGSLILKLADNDVDHITAPVVIEAVKKHDRTACAIWKDAVRYLGISAANIIQTFNPEMIVIGGGVSKAGDLLFKPLRETARKYSWERCYKACSIVPAELGDNVGDLGAVSLVINTV